MSDRLGQSCPQVVLDLAVGLLADTRFGSPLMECVQRYALLPRHLARLRREGIEQDKKSVERVGCVGPRTDDPSPTTGPTPVRMTIRGPRASTTRPTNGLKTAEKRKPKEKAPAAIIEGVGKKVIVKINDVGPLTPGRIIDLNERTMRLFDPSLELGVIYGVTVRPLSGDYWIPGPVG